MPAEKPKRKYYQVKSQGGNIVIKITNPWFAATLARRLEGGHQELIDFSKELFSLVAPLLHEAEK